MPPKARIESEAFQRALYTLEPDKFCLLDSSSTASAIWGYLCVLMNKADNAQNRRACYDIWKRIRVEFLSIIDESLQKNTLKSTIHQSDPSPIPSNDVREMADTNKTTKYSGEVEMSSLSNVTPVSIPIHVYEIAEINIWSVFFISSY